jgi:hypothetical protein
MNYEQQAELERRLGKWCDEVSRPSPGGTSTLADSEAQLAKDYETRKRGEQAFSDRLEALLCRYR